MCKKCRFHTQIVKKSPYPGRGKHTLSPLGHFAPLLWPPLTNPCCWEGGHPSPPPPPRSLRSLAYYRPPKIKSWLRHWSPCDQILCLVRAQVHFVYSAHVHNLMTSLLMFIHASSQPSTKIWGTE